MSYESDFYAMRDALPAEQPPIEMRRVYLRGELGEKFGEMWDFAADSIQTPADIVRAIGANREGFQKELIDASDQGVGYVVIVSDESWGSDEVMTRRPLGSARVIELIPMPLAAGGNASFIQILVGIVLIIAGIVLIATPFGVPLIAVGVSLLLGGIIGLILAPPDSKDQAEFASAQFSSVDALSPGGRPVPVLYGEGIVDGIPISLGLRAIDPDLITKSFGGQFSKAAVSVNDLLAFEGTGGADQELKILYAISEGPIEGPVSIDPSLPTILTPDQIVSINGGEVKPYYTYSRNLYGGQTRSNPNAPFYVQYLIDPNNQADIDYYTALDAIGFGDLDIIPISGSPLTRTIPFGPSDAGLEQSLLKRATLLNDQLAVDYYMPNVFRDGSGDQEPPADWAALETLTSVGLEQRFGIQQTRTTAATNLTSVGVTIRIPSLLKTSKKGQQQNNVVRWTVTITPQGGGAVPGDTVTRDLEKFGILTSAVSYTTYFQTRGPGPWKIDVTKTTPDSFTRSQQDLFWESFVEVGRGQYSFPFTALAGLRLRALEWPQIPKAKFRMRGRKVRVPSNYNAVTRIYTGDWNGTFKAEEEYTNNPAWCVLDWLTNRRYGLGDVMRTEDVDIWSLYRIAQRCDEMLDDGNGVIKPRHTYNEHITTFRKAWRQLANMCSSFLGQPVWPGSKLEFIQDRPEEPIFTFSPTNVLNGMISYSRTQLDVRINRAVVRFHDEDNRFEPGLATDEDQASIDAFGLNERIVEVPGATDYSTAKRLARWIIQAEKLSKIVSFSSGPEGYTVRPGQSFWLVDPYVGAERSYGRTLGSAAPLTESSTATSGTVGSLNDTAQSWTINQHQGAVVTLRPGTTKEEKRNIIANDSDSLFPAINFDEPPSPGDEYLVLDNQTVTLDREVTLESGESYELDLMFGDEEERQVKAANSGVLVLSSPLANDDHRNARVWVDTTGDGNHDTERTTNGYDSATLTLTLVPAALGATLREFRIEYPVGVTQRPVFNGAGTYTTLAVGTPYHANLPEYANWSLVKLSQGRVKYRCVGTSASQTSGSVEITGLIDVDARFAYVEENIELPQLDQSITPPPDIGAQPPPPLGLHVQQVIDYNHDGSVRFGLQLRWAGPPVGSPNADTVVSYLVSYQKLGETVMPGAVVTRTEWTLWTPAPGIYTFTVQSQGWRSGAQSSPRSIVYDFTVPSNTPAEVVNLEVEGTGGGEYTGSDIHLVCGVIPGRFNALSLEEFDDDEGELSSEENEPTVAELVWEFFETDTFTSLATFTTIDQKFTLNFDQNARLEGGPHRELEVEVRPIDIFGNHGIGKRLRLNNPPRALPVNITISEQSNYAVISFDDPERDADQIGYIAAVHLVTAGETDFTPVRSEYQYSRTDPITIAIQPGLDYLVKIAGYDGFSDDLVAGELIVSAAIPVSAKEIDLNQLAPAVRIHGLTLINAGGVTLDSKTVHVLIGDIDNFFHSDDTDTEIIIDVRCHFPKLGTIIDSDFAGSSARHWRALVYAGYTDAGTTYDPSDSPTNWHSFPTGSAIQLYGPVSPIGLGPGDYFGMVGLDFARLFLVTNTASLLYNPIRIGFWGLQSSSVTTVEDIPVDRCSIIATEQRISHTF